MKMFRMKVRMRVFLDQVAYPAQIDLMILPNWMRAWLHPAQIDLIMLPNWTMKRVFLDQVATMKAFQEQIDLMILPNWTMKRVFLDQVATMKACQAQINLMILPNLTRMMRVFL